MICKQLSELIRQIKSIWQTYALTTDRDSGRLNSKKRFFWTEFVPPKRIIWIRKTADYMNGRVHLKGTSEGDIWGGHLKGNAPQSVVWKMKRGWWWWEMVVRLYRNRLESPSAVENLISIYSKRWFDLRINENQNQDLSNFFLLVLIFKAKFERSENPADDNFIDHFRGERSVPLKINLKPSDMQIMMIKTALKLAQIIS